MEEEKKVIRGYKGFDKDLKCRGFQYEVGKEYKCEKAVACVEGFHFCENPFDVFRYYPPSVFHGPNRFCKVEGSGNLDLSEVDKVCCTNIKVGEEIGLQEIIEEGIKLIKDGSFDSKEYTKVFMEESSSVASNTGYCSVVNSTGFSSVSANVCYSSVAENEGNVSVAVNTGENSASVSGGSYSIAANTGECSVAVSSGYGSSSANTGSFSLSVNSGYCSFATNVGENSVSSNMGNFSASGNTGDFSTAKNSGDYSLAATVGSNSNAIITGKCSVAINIGSSSIAESKGDGSAALSFGGNSSASVEGEDSVAIVIGKGCKAKGALGSWIVLTERDEWDGECYPIKEVKAIKVDGETIKPDTYYKLVDGEAVEVTD